MTQILYGLDIVALNNYHINIIRKIMHWGKRRHFLPKLHYYVL